MLSLGNDALGPLMAGAGECGVDAETAGAALDPTGKGENWLRELGKEMATDANLRSLTRAILQL